jgi:hypothetical protein
MTTNEIPTAVLRELVSTARDLGMEHGRNAADWFAQDAFGGRHTGDSKAAALRILQQLDDGDPELWDAANVPNLSGEWADSMTTRKLSQYCANEVGYDHDNIDPDTEDRLAGYYEDAAQEWWTYCVHKMATEYAKD